MHTFKGHDQMRVIAVTNFFGNFGILGSFGQRRTALKFVTATGAGLSWLILWMRSQIHGQS
jgi:hypothetical protein